VFFTRKDDTTSDGGVPRGRSPAGISRGVKPPDPRVFVAFGLAAESGGHAEYPALSPTLKGLS
jgi:hypothetical protein